MFTKSELEKNTFSLAMDNTLGSANFSGVKMFRKNDGSNNLVIQAMPVFRSGTFRNSWGEQTTYSDLHIQQMVTNFDYLKQTGIFADIPVRSSHPEPWFRNSTEEVIGYVSSLTTEKRQHPVTGQEYTYLLADYEVSDPTAAEKIEKKLYRNRSAEVGMYADNDDAEYYPVLLGFAYVDIPAVEGLNFGKRAEVRRYALDEEGSQVGAENTDEVTDDTEDTQDTQEESQNEEEAPEVEETSEEDNNEEPPAGGNFVVPEGSGDVTVNTEPPNDETDPPLGAPIVGIETEGTGTFAGGHVSINFNGQTITDPAAIQGIVDSLFGVVKEDRNSYVNLMFTANRITASQKKPLEEFVADLTVEQWGRFRSIFDDSPEIQALSFRGGDAPNTVEVKKAQETEQLNSQVVEHLRLALGSERLKETGIYQRLNGGNKEGSK